MDEDCTNGTSEEVYLSMKNALAKELGPKVGLQDGFMEPFVYGKTTLAKAVKASLSKKKVKGVQHDAAVAVHGEALENGDQPSHQATEHSKICLDQIPGHTPAALAPC